MEVFITIPINTKVKAKLERIAKSNGRAMSREASRIIEKAVEVKKQED